MTVEKENFNGVDTAKAKQMEMLRAKYLSTDGKKPTNLEMAERLDAKVESKAMIVALSLGIISSLVMGLGISFALVWKNLPIGIVVGVIGMLGIAVTWPAYQKTLAKERERNSAEILRLIDKA